MRTRTFKYFKNKRKITRMRKFKGFEKKETWIPSSVLGNTYSLQRWIENELFTNFDYISPTTEQTIEDVVKYFNLNEDVLLIWPSWVGKSSITKEVAKRMKLPYIDLQVTDNLQESDLQSQLSWNEWELENTFSPFLDYWANGGVVELKELNMASVLTFLNNFLDKNGTIIINDTEYKRHPHFHIISTINPFDNRIYQWTKPLNLAVQARFKTVNIDYLEKDEEKKVLLEIAKMFNPKLLENGLEQALEDILNLIVSPIRNKIEELIKTQGEWSDESLKILAHKNITIDILSNWIKTSQSIENIRGHIQKHLKLEQEKLDILPSDIKQIFTIYNS